MKTSLENKSKILKLVNKQNKLKFWNKNGNWILMANAFISLISFSIFTGINFGIGLTLLAVCYTSLSILGICVNHSLKDKTIKKIGDIDQQVLELVKQDEEEFEILKEYNNVQKIESKLIEQKRLLKELIERKYNKKRKLTTRKDADIATEDVLEIENTID